MESKKQEGGCSPADGLPVASVKDRASLGFGAYVPKQEMGYFSKC